MLQSAVTRAPRCCHCRSARRVRAGIDGCSHTSSAAGSIKCSSLVRFFVSWWRHCSRSEEEAIILTRHKKICDDGGRRKTDRDTEALPDQDYITVWRTWRVCVKGFIDSPNPFTSLVVYTSLTLTVERLFVIISNTLSFWNSLFLSLGFGVCFWCLWCFWSFFFLSRSWWN